MWEAFVGDPEGGYYSVGEALWLNIGMFVVAEMLILILALVVAVVRQSHRPGAAAAAAGRPSCTSTCARGVPLILIIYRDRVRRPGAGDEGHLVPVAARLRGGRAGLVVFGLRVRGVPRGHRPRCTAARPRPLARSGLSAVGLDALRDAAAGDPDHHPAAAERLHQPAEGHGSGRRCSGAIEANRAAEIDSDAVFNYSCYTVAALLFLLLTIPLARFTDHLIARDQARRLAGAGWAER